MFPRIYALEINKDCTVADKLQFSVTSSLRRSVRGGVESSQLALLQTYIEGTLLSNMEDRWVWDLNGEGVFRVKDVRILLDECFLPKAPTATRWVKYVPIKINVFAWKVFLDRLPTRSNLQHRGVLVSDLLCPLCSSAQEDSSHLFFSCRLATDIVRLVCRWWNLSWTPLGSYADWLNWFNSIRLSSKVKDLLEGVLYITWWSVWMFRNQLLFSSKAPRKDVIFDDIVSTRLQVYVLLAVWEKRRRTIDQAAGGKLRDKNDEESWALLEDLALYDNESWNAPRDFDKPVKVISMPHDVPGASDRRLIELENQVQRMMEAYLSQSKPVQVNKIASSCEICSGPHNTQYCMEDPERGFVEYVSTHAKTSRFEADFKQYQSEVTNKLDAFLKAFNDQMTWLLPSDTVKNPKLNTNPTSSARSHPAGDPQSSSNSFKLVNAIDVSLCGWSEIWSIRRIQGLGYGVSGVSWSRDHAQIRHIFLDGYGVLVVRTDQFQVNTLTVSENETPTLKEPKKTLEDEFADLHLNRPVLEVLAHVPMYDALLDKYIVSLELGENGSEYIQSIAPEKIKDPGLFILPCRLGDSKPFDTLADLGSCVNLLPLKLFKKLKVGLLEVTDDVLGLADGTKSYPVGIVRNVHVGKLKLFEDFHVVHMEREPTCPLLVGRGFLATANAVIDCKKAKIAIGEGLTRSIFGVKELDFGDDNEAYWTTIGKRASYKPRNSKDGIGSIPINLKGNMWESEDLIENPINWNRLPKEGDGAWHIRIELIDPDGEKFDRAFQSIPTNRRLSLKENPSDILNLDHFHDS
ncbi:MAK10-like protein [Tanacetum coccineum]